MQTHYKLHRRYRIKVSVLEKVKRTIDKYGLLDPAEGVIVALSGGKDSIFLTVALSELGYKVLPVAVDMGYENGWGNRVYENMRSLGFETRILPVREAKFQLSIPPIALTDVRRRLTMLDSIKPGMESNGSPCTHCYNVKTITLVTAAEREGYTKIAFGHHATDAVASLLKSAFMYIDRWDKNHEVFNRHNFGALIEEVAPDFLRSYADLKSSPVVRRVQELVECGLAGTDEPPMQELLVSRCQTKVVRPLFSVNEGETAYYRAFSQIQTEGSGCGHGATRETETPREMIHWRLLNEMANGQDANRKLTFLLHQAKRGLLSDGSLAYNVRNNRSSILGAAYRSGEGCDVKF